MNYSSVQQVLQLCDSATRFLDDDYKSGFKEGLVCLGLGAQRHHLCLKWIAGNREWGLRKGACVKWSLPFPGRLLQNTGVLGASSPWPESSCFAITYCLPLAVLLIFRINSVHTEFLLMPTCFYQQPSPAAWAVIWSSGRAGGCGVCQRCCGEARVLAAA